MSTTWTIVWVVAILVLALALVALFAFIKTFDPERNKISVTRIISPEFESRESVNRARDLIAKVSRPDSDALERSELAVFKYKLYKSQDFAREARSNLETIDFAGLSLRDSYRLFGVLFVLRDPDLIARAARENENADTEYGRFTLGIRARRGPPRRALLRSKEDFCTEAKYTARLYMNEFEPRFGNLFAANSAFGMMTPSVSSLEWALANSFAYAEVPDNFLPSTEDISIYSYITDRNRKRKPRSRFCLGSLLSFVIVDGGTVYAANSDTETVVGKFSSEEFPSVLGGLRGENVKRPSGHVLDLNVLNENGGTVVASLGFLGKVVKGRPPTEPTDPPTEPTDPPTEPTDPPTEPTEPPTEPTEPTTDPPTEPTDPPTEPTDPTTDPPTEPTEPPTEPTEPTTARIFDPSKIVVPDSLRQKIHRNIARFGSYLNDLKNDADGTEFSQDGYRSEDSLAVLDAKNNVHDRYDQNFEHPCFVCLERGGGVLSRIARFKFDALGNLFYESTPVTLPEEKKLNQ